MSKESLGGLLGARLHQEWTQQRQALGVLRDDASLQGMATVLDSTAGAHRQHTQLRHSLGMWHAATSRAGMVNRMAGQARALVQRVALRAALQAWQAWHETLRPDLDQARAFFVLRRLGAAMGVLCGIRARGQAMAIALAQEGCVMHRRLHALCLAHLFAWHTAALTRRTDALGVSHYDWRACRQVLPSLTLTLP